MPSTSSFNILAGILILLGIAFILENYGIVKGLWFFWPLVPLVLGVGFTMLFFRTRKDLILLGLGSFITMNSLFFFFLNATSWKTLAYLWPVFIVLIGLTFFACYIVSWKRILAYLAIPLMALGIAFILIFAISVRLWPITLVLTGASFIIITHFDRKGKTASPDIHAKKK